MASRALASTSLLLSFNLLFFTLVSSSYCPPPSLPKPKVPSLKPTYPSPVVPSSELDKCLKDTLKLGACANLLNLLKLKIGKPPMTPCCSLINGLVDLDSTICLCAAIKANVLGNNLEIPVSLSLLLNAYGKKAPEGFQCK